MQQEGNWVRAVLVPVVPCEAPWLERGAAEAQVVMGRRAIYLLGTRTGRPGGLRSLGHVWERGSRKKGLATAGLAVSSGLGRRW